MTPEEQEKRNKIAEKEEQEIQQAILESVKPESLPPSTLPPKYLDRDVLMAGKSENKAYLERLIGAKRDAMTDAQWSQRVAERTFSHTSNHVC